MIGIEVITNSIKDGVTNSDASLPAAFKATIAPIFSFIMLRIKYRKIGL